MRFTWDQQKSERNLLDRGFDFAFASQIFHGWVVERDDTRRDYGELRVKAIGIADGVYLSVIYTDRVEDESIVRRIISARWSSPREREEYEKEIRRRASH